MKKKQTLAQREKKYAKTRFALLGVFLKYVKEQRDDELTIDDFCMEVGISRGTFFNYFPSREHIFTYYGYYFSTRLWLELKRKRDMGISIKEQIQYVFEFTALENRQYVNSFGKYISHVLRRDEGVKDETKFTRADLLFIFPKEAEIILNEPLFPHPYGGKKGLASKDILYIPNVGEVFEILLREGIEKGEIRKDVKVKETQMKLLALYFSPPILSKFLSKGDHPRELYQKLLPELMEQL